MMKLKTLIQKAIELEEEFGDNEVLVLGPVGDKLQVDDLSVYVGQGTTVVIEASSS